VNRAFGFSTGVRRDPALDQRRQDVAGTHRRGAMRDFTGCGERLRQIAGERAGSTHGRRSVVEDEHALVAFIGAGRQGTNEQHERDR